MAEPRVDNPLVMYREAARAGFDLPEEIDAVVVARRGNSPLWHVSELCASARATGVWQHETIRFAQIDQLTLCSKCRDDRLVTTPKKAGIWLRGALAAAELLEHDEIDGFVSDRQLRNWVSVATARAVCGHRGLDDAVDRMQTLCAPRLEEHRRVVQLRTAVDILYVDGRRNGPARRGGEHSAFVDHMCRTIDVGGVIDRLRASGEFEDDLIAEFERDLGEDDELEYETVAAAGTGGFAALVLFDHVSVPIAHGSRLVVGLAPRTLGRSFQSVSSPVPAGCDGATARYLELVGTLVVDDMGAYLPLIGSPEEGHREQFAALLDACSAVDQAG